MIVKGMTIDQLDAAANTVGVAINDPRELNQRGNRVRFTIRPLRDANGKADRTYGRLSASGFHRERRVFAVCWHGHRDFFRECFRINPDAIFQTAVSTWKGSADFEARHRESGYKNVGSQMFPALMCDVCECSERGEVD